MSATAKPARAALRYQPLAIALALAGGVFGAAGAIVQELQSGGGLVLLFLGAPIIEEILKPVGIYVLLARWPQALLGRLHTAALAAVSGIAFGLLESALYVSLYVSDPSRGFFVYRFSVPVLMHATTSLIVGTGLTAGLMAWANGEGRFPVSSRNAYLVAIAIHALFNITAFSLATAGVLDFSR